MRGGEEESLGAVQEDERRREREERGIVGSGETHESVALLDVQGAAQVAGELG